MLRHLWRLCRQLNLTSARRYEHGSRLLVGIGEQVGGLSDRLGGSLEDLAVETVPAVLAQEWGLEGIASGRETFHVAGKEEEVDLVLRGSRPDGSDLLVLGEVKSRLTEREVARRALVKGLAPSEVAELTGLTLGEVQMLAH